MILDSIPLLLFGYFYKAQAEYEFELVAAGSFLSYYQLLYCKTNSEVSNWRCQFTARASRFSSYGVWRFVVARKG